MALRWQVYKIVDTVAVIQLLQDGKFIASVGVGLLGPFRTWPQRWGICLRRALARSGCLATPSIQIALSVHFHFPKCFTRQNETNKYNKIENNLKMKKSARGGS